MGATALLATLAAGTVNAAAPPPAPAPVTPVAVAPILPTPPNFLSEYLVADPDNRPFPAAFITGTTTIVTGNGGSVVTLLPHILIVKVRRDPNAVMLGIQALAQRMLSRSVETTFNYPVRLSAPIAAAQVPPCHLSQSCQTADPFAPEYYLGPAAVGWPMGALQTSPRANDLMTSQGSGSTVALIDAPPIALEPVGELPPISFGFNIGPPASAFLPGHGTQVASVIFGQRNGLYSQGIAPGARREHYGVGIPNLGSIGGISGAAMLLSDVIYLFEYLANTPFPPDVLTMSAGLPFGFTPLRDVIRRISERGVLMFFASGNEGANDCLYPGRYNFPNSICVGATGVIVGSAVDSYQVAPYSNRGVELALPGTAIPVPMIDNAGVLVRDASGNVVYELGNGTSFSTPHAAALAARIISELRNNPARYPQVALLTRAEIAGYVRNLLFTNTTDIEAVGFDRDSGHGIPDLVAIYEQMQADARPSSFQMNQTIQEWNDPNFYGNPILSQFFQRTSASNPLTRIAVNFTFSSGSCASINGKISMGKPKLDVSISNFQASITSLTADRAIVDLTYDLRIPVRIEIDYLLPFLSCILPIPVQITATGDWRSNQTGYTNTMRIEYKLDGEGYRMDQLTVSGPETKDLFIGFQGVPSIFNSVLNNYNGMMRDFAIPAIRLFEEGANDHIVQMVERMLNGTLSGERQDPYAYFKFRRPEPLGELPMALEYFTSRDRHTHFAGIGSNQSIFPVVASGLPGMTPIGPVPDPALGPNPLDVTQGIEKSTYGFELDYLWRSGVFDTMFNNQLVANIRTTTESQPDAADAVDVRIDNVIMVAPPFIVPDQTVMGYFARLQLLAIADVSVNGGPPGTVLIDYRPYVAEYSMFKEYERESDFAPFPLDLRWEDRLVIDPFQEAPATEIPVFTLLGFPEQTSLITPPLPVISTAEISEVVRATILNEYHRALGSVSTKRLGLDARLGQGWGCFGPVVAFVNLYSQQLAGQDFLDLRSESGCWDLNIGIFGPRRETQIRDLTDHFAQDDTLNPRRAPQNLVPVAANPNAFFMNHPQDPRYTAAVLPLSYSAPGSMPDFFYSVNGEWHTPPGANTSVQALEEVWQATQARAGGQRFFYVPEKTSFAPGEKASFELLGAARDSAPAQLEVGSCWVRFRVEFQYRRWQNFSVGPTNTQPLAAENYQQTRVNMPNDAWQNIANCGGGKGTEPPIEDIMEH